MAFELSTSAGMLLLLRTGKRWAVEFNGRRTGKWGTPNDAAIAVANHRSGILEWDIQQRDASEDILDWRPIGESI
jgi:hypothetical protein